MPVERILDQFTVFPDDVMNDARLDAKDHFGLVCDNILFMRWYAFRLSSVDVSGPWHQGHIRIGNFQWVVEIGFIERNALGLGRNRSTYEEQRKKSNRPDYP